MTQDLFAARFKDPESVREFALAGNARLTLVSTVTGQRFTYRIRKPENQRGSVSHFVSLMNGPDNESSFAYLGVLKTTPAGTRFERGAKSSISAEAPSAKAFAWFWQHLMQGKISEKLEIWHEGRCGRCGRALTDPESIAFGFGPECIQHVNGGRNGFNCRAASAQEASANL
jgi:hypothetical protein